MLPLSPLLLLVFPAAILVAAQGAGDLHSFSLPGGSAGFDPTDPCMGVSPPCISEADRYSLEALRSIHLMMDDDQDGGIEVEESVERQTVLSSTTTGVLAEARVKCYFEDSNECCAPIEYPASQVAVSIDTSGEGPGLIRTQPLDSFRHHMKPPFTAKDTFQERTDTHYQEHAIAGFIIEDMKQQQTNKHSHLHREDQHITVEELWRGWKSSQVHNWTQEEVLRWLREFVELPHYERNFKDFKVNGNTLPRIAANEPSFLSGQLRVQDQRDKQKLSIKALDVVLFGPPTRPPHNYMKDLLLVVSVVMGVGGCWFAQAQNKVSKVHVTKMIKDLESLQRAEQSLTDLQEQLERAQEEKRNVAEEKQNLEEKMRGEIIGAQEEAHRLHELRQGAVTELSRLRYAEEELEQVLGALKQAEKDMQASWNVSEALQQWLQLTHEVELQYYNVKKQSAELQLATAKEEAEKIKKKRSSVLGTLHVAHGSSLDQVDHKILEAKNALCEVTACLRERLHRWQYIERLCGFPIMRNPGLANLTAQLYSDSITLGLPRVPQPSCSCHSSVHGSVEDLFEESASPIVPQMQAPSLKRSPRTQGSAKSRPRRSAVIAQPAATMMSPDPDLLIPIRAPYSCFDGEEKFTLKSLKKQDSLEMYSDTEYITSPPLSKMFRSPALDASSQKLYHDEPEPHADPSITKTFSREVDAVVPVHKVTTEELELAVDAACRKMAKDKLLDSSLEGRSLKMSKEEYLLDVTQRKTSRDRMDAPMDAPVRKGLSSELDAELSPRGVERDTPGDLLDTASRNVFRDRSDLPLDVRKIIWTELEATNQPAPRKISRDMMGSSLDSISRKIIREDAQNPFDLVPRRLAKDSMGISLETGSRKLPRSKGEGQLESPVRALAMDKMVETARAPRKISRDELEYCADTAPPRAPPREKFHALLDTSSCTEKQECGVEPSVSRRMPRDEHQLSAGSLRRRIPRMTREDSDSSFEDPTGKFWERGDAPAEIPKQAPPKEKFGAADSSSTAGRYGQPDLMVTSQVPWTSSDPVRPLSQLVYDGILEKSTCNHPQRRLQEEAEPPLPPPRVANPPLASPPETREEKNKDKEKEKNKKSLKLKSLFKKRNESAPEKPPSGLQKL